MKTLLSTLVLLAGAVPAQTCIYTWGTDPAGNLPPLANGMAFLSAPANNGYYRKHLLLPATLFANVPHRITDFSLPVKEGWRRLHLPQLIVRMGQTTRTQLSPTFAQNITAPLQDVLVANDHVFFEGIGPVWVPLGMQQPFLFVPGQGNLLIEVIQYGGTSLEEVAYTGLAEGHVGSIVNSSFETTLPTLGGNPTPSVPRFRLCVDHPELSLLGAACGGSTNTPPQLGLAGEPSLGNQTVFWLGNAPASSLALLAFGFDNRPPFPIDLGSQGAPGCRQYFPVVVATAVITDNLGIGQHVVQIPNNAALAGTIVLGQYVALRPGSNSLGVLTSNYGRVLIGR